jgi:hypothetical protein
MHFSPDLVGLDLHDASSLACKRLRLLQWFVDQWPRLHDRENHLEIRRSPPQHPVDGDVINARRAVVIVDDASIEWWSAKGDPRFDWGRRTNGLYMCERIYSWQTFVELVRHWLVINGWEVDRFLRDNVGSSDCSAIIRSHGAAKAAQFQCNREWLIATAHDADPLLGRLMSAVFQEDVAMMESLASEPRLRTLGLGESDLLHLRETIQAGDIESTKLAKREMASRLGMLTFGVWQSRGQFAFSGPEDSLRIEADLLYLKSLEAVKAAAVAFYTQRFEQWGAHRELGEFGDQLFAGQAYVDPFDTV